MQSASVGAKENTPLPLAVVCYRCRSHYGVGGSAPTINSPLNGGGRNVLTLTHSVWPLRIYIYILWYIYASRHYAQTKTILLYQKAFERPVADCEQASQQSSFLEVRLLLTVQDIGLSDRTASLNTS